MSGDAGQRPESVSEGLALLEHHFFGSEDPGASYLRAESFRENVIRLIVFDMHLGIEELLRAHLYEALCASSRRREETADYVKGLSSRAALELAAQLGLIEAHVYGQLRELNSLRNRAAHHWEPGEPLRHRAGVLGSAYLLRWNGRPLTPAAVKDEFLAVYGSIYTALLDSWRAAHAREAATR